MKFTCAFLLAAFMPINAHAQNTRLSERNDIAWLSYTGTIKLAAKWSLHTEYQWRRANFLEHWQQGLARLGVNYSLSPAATAQLGYAYVLTYNYGEYPLNALGKNYPEHRIHEQLSLSQKVGRIDLTHRFRLEQRWVGRFSSASAEHPDSYVYLNRIRYMLRVTLPLKGAALDDREPYLAVYNELFTGFGKDVGENIFDQNRIGILAGYRFDKALRLEGGYLNQTVQLGREIGGRNVFQYNNGVLISGIVNI